MKKFSIKLVSIITASVVTYGFLGTSIANAQTLLNQTTNAQSNAGLSEAVGGKYGTNTIGYGKEKTITIDGSFSDWSEDMLVAQGVANDEPRAFRGAHEYPVYDDYSMYAAWDNDNLYVAWQIANPNDIVCGQNGVGTNEAKPYNADQPQIIALDIDPNKTGSPAMANGKYIWEKTLDFQNGIDTALYFSTKPGVGTPGFFKADETGKFNYDPEYCLNFKTLGIEYKYADGFMPSSMIGINGIADLGMDALYNESSPWQDILILGHNTKLDTFYEMKIPFSALGITKDYLTQNGIGLFHVSIYGSSGVSSLPHDPVVLDNALLPYGPDTASSHEKEDLDTFTVPTARVGKASGDVVVTSPKISDVTSNLASPQKVGSQITFNTQATGGTGTLQYQYEVNGTVQKAYSTSNSFNFVPTTAGTYTIKSTVKDTNGKTATKSVTYVIEENVAQKDVIVNSLTSNIASPQKVGTSINLSASATGEGSIQYRYTVENSTGTEVIKNYSTVSNATWTPSIDGTYVITVTAKDANGNTSSKTMNYTINKATTQNDLVLNSVSTDKVSPQNVGQGIKISANATGEGTVKYRFVAVSGSVKTVIQDYNANSTATWNPTVAGTYNIYALATDSTGKTVQKIISNYVIKDSATLKINSVTTDKLSPQNVGTAIKISTSATGSGNLQYRYVAVSGSNKQVIKDYSSNSTVTWTPNSDGVYNIYAIVKDGTGKTVQKILTGYSVIKTEKISFKGITFDKLSPQNAGTSIKITANARGNSALSYAFWTYDANGDWKLLKNYSSSNTVTWTPTVAGTNLVWVDIKDANGNIVSKYSEYITNNKATKIEQTDSKIVYTGTFATSTGASHSGNSIKYTNTIGSKMTMKFTGTGIKILSATSSNRGIAKVTIDGVVYSADMYSSAYEYQKAVFEKTGLANKEHTITIECVGLHNQKSTGTMITIDAFEIIG